MAEPSRKLSSEEVNALMEGLKSGDLSASTTIKDESKVDIRHFNLARMIFLYWVIITL